MASVTQRIKEIKQPRGGYLKPSEFEKIQFETVRSLFVAAGEGEVSEKVLLREILVRSCSLGKV